jgi:hypothetical protein
VRDQVLGQVVEQTTKFVEQEVASYTAMADKIGIRR